MVINAARSTAMMRTPKRVSEKVIARKKFICGRPHPESWLFISAVAQNLDASVFKLAASPA
jgi:hypothetical protein